MYKTTDVNEFIYDVNEFIYYVLGEQPIFTLGKSDPKFIRYYVCFVRMDYILGNFYGSSEQDVLQKALSFLELELDKYHEKHLNGSNLGLTSLEHQSIINELHRCIIDLQNEINRHLHQTQVVCNCCNQEIKDLALDDKWNAGYICAKCNNEENA